MHDPARRLSTHRSSDGIVVYFRCACGRPRVALEHITAEAPDPATRYAEEHGLVEGTYTE